MHGSVPVVSAWFSAPGVRLMVWCGAGFSASFSASFSKLRGLNGSV